MLSKQGLSIHKNLLRKIAKDERISPNRRLLAEMLLLHLEDILPISLLVDIFGKPNRIANVDVEDQAEKVDAISEEARIAIKKVYTDINFKEENNGTANIDTTGI